MAKKLPPEAIEQLISESSDDIADKFFTAIYRLMYACLDHSASKWNKPVHRRSASAEIRRLFVMLYGLPTDFDKGRINALFEVLHWQHR